MKLAVDQLAQKLAAELGDHWVSADAHIRAGHTIDEREPSLVCAPAGPEQIAAALRLCAEAGATVAPYGGGTAITIGNAALPLDVALDLNRLNRVVEHDHANLTATIEAGITLAGLQRFLGQQKQFAPFDPPHPERATVGGIVATNLSGPRRSYYGSVRDLVIGMKVVLASGELIKAGGKVVKNVAGYDMCKLFVGSLGTLGIITQITLRASPVPESAATWIASGSRAMVTNLAHAIADSPLLPAAVVIMNPSACEELNFGGADWKLALCSEGFAETVARHMRDATALGERLGLAAESLEDSQHSRFWAAIENFPLSSERLIFRLTVPRAATADAVKAVESWQADGFRSAMVADPMAGVLWIAAPASAAAANHFPRLIAYAHERRGHAVMLAAPLEFKQSLDVWGSPPPALGLMRHIKEQFDPHRLLNPGRFIGRI